MFPCTIFCNNINHKLFKNTERFIAAVKIVISDWTILRHVQILPTILMETKMFIVLYF
jgi:hypothetical protein